jgi:hypothetical protein
MQYVILTNNFNIKDHKHTLKINEILKKKKKHQNFAKNWIFMVIFQICIIFVHKK